MTDQTPVAADAPAQEPVSDPIEAALDEARQEEAKAAKAGQQPQDAEASEGEAAPAKPRKSANERIAELTYARREAERRAAELEVQLRQVHSAPRPQARDPLNPASYQQGQFDPAYQAALIEQKVAEATRHAIAQERAQEEQRRSIQRWETQTKEAMDRHEDFSDLVIAGANEGTWACTPDMRDLIVQSDIGADVAYALAKDSDLSFRIAAMSPVQQAREIGKLEARIEAERSRPKPPNTTTRAPEPAPQVRGSSGRFGVAPDTTDFAAFERQYGA
jgi:hypothetical protein